MENTGDSNSESDISDSWALIDEDSALEWNNEMGLGPRQYVFEESEVGLPRTSSRNELNDEDSIEVVADDHTDNLSDTEAKETKGEQWTENVDLPESKGNNTVEEGIIRDGHSPSQLKKYRYTEYRPTPLLITILILGIAGGITVGYSWGSYASQLHLHKDSASTQHARSLLARLQNENLFLNSQLRLAHSSLELAVSKVLVPKFKDSIKLGINKKSKENSSSVDYSGMCTITDYILQSSLYPNDASKDICVASDRPHQNRHGLASNANSVNAGFNSVDVSLSKEHVEMVTNPSRKVNHGEPNGNVAVDTKEFDKTSEVLSQSTSFLSHDNLLGEGLHRPYKDPPHLVEHSGNEMNNAGVDNVVGGTDSRPYTKIRAIVENVYSVLSLYGNDVLTAFPSKLELLNILPQNVAALDFARESLTTDNYEKIAAFKSHMQGASQKLFGDIETSVNRLIRNIASKLKKFEIRSTKQACKLKKSLENSPDIAHVVDLNAIPIFQKCIEYRPHGHDDERGKDILKMNDPLSENKEGVVLSTSRKPNHDQINEKEGTNCNDHNQKNENIQQTQTQNGDVNSKKRSNWSHQKISEGQKKSRKIKNSVPENKKLKTHDDGIEQEKDSSMKLKNESDQHEKEMRKKKQRDGKKSKMEEMHTNFAHSSHKKYGKKRTFDSKMEKKFDGSNGEHKEVEKDTVNIDEPNKSGEWVLKMAHARAEQRRREHQSDWLFERAESRKSSRGENKEPWKNNKESFWHSYEYSPTRDLFSSYVCNKTKTSKDQASQAWKGIKHHVKENVWRPIVDTAKTAKRAFSDFNKYHSRRE